MMTIETTTRSVVSMDVGTISELQEFDPMNEKGKGVHPVEGSIEDFIIDSEVHSTMEHILDIIEVVEECILKIAEAEIADLILELHDSNSREVEMDKKDWGIPGEISMADIVTSDVRGKEESLDKTDAVIEVHGTLAGNPEVMEASTEIQNTETPETVETEAKDCVTPETNAFQDYVNPEEDHSAALVEDKVSETINSTDLAMDVEPSTVPNKIAFEIFKPQETIIAVEIAVDTKVSRSTDTDDFPSSQNQKHLKEGLPPQTSNASSQTGLNLNGIETLQPEHCDKATSCDIIMKDASTSTDLEKVMIDAAVGTSDNAIHVGAELVVSGPDRIGKDGISGNGMPGLEYQFHDLLDLDVPFFPTKTRRMEQNNRRVSTNGQPVKNEPTFRRKTPGLPAIGNGNGTVPKSSALYDSEGKKNTKTTSAIQDIVELSSGFPTSQDKENSSINSRPVQTGLKRLGLSKLGKPRKPLHSNIQVVIKKVEAPPAKNSVDDEEDEDDQ